MRNTKSYIITEKQLLQISRILEIMNVEKDLLIETRIGKWLTDKIWTNIRKNLSSYKRKYGFSDNDLNLVLNALDGEKIYTLLPSVQKQLALLIKSEYEEIIPDIYKSAIELWLKENPYDNYKGLLQILKSARDASGKNIEDLLTSGLPGGKAVIQDVNGNPDFFSIKLISSRLDEDVKILERGGKNFIHSVEQPSRPKMRERLASRLDRTKIGKYETSKAFYEGMLRNEPGSIYFFNYLRTGLSNAYRSIAKKDLLQNLTSDEKKVMYQWLATGVADWRMVRRIWKNVGGRKNWPKALLDTSVNVSSQLLKKWIFLSLLFTGLKVARDLAEAAPGDAVELDTWDAFGERIWDNKTGASFGLTSPLLRLSHLIWKVGIVPLVKGRSKYKEALLEYLDMKIEETENQLEKVSNGQNIKVEEYDKINDNSEMPKMDVGGIPMPNPKNNTLDTTGRALGTSTTTQNKSDSSAIIDDEL